MSYAKGLIWGFAVLFTIAIALFLFVGAQVRLLDGLGIGTVISIVISFVLLKILGHFAKKHNRENPKRF
jgi:hypothetical protein